MVTLTEVFLTTEEAYVPSEVFEIICKSFSFMHMSDDSLEVLFMYFFKMVTDNTNNNSFLHDDCVHWNLVKTPEDTEQDEY